GPPPLSPAGWGRGTSYQYDLAGNVTRTSMSGQPSNVPWAMPATGQVVDYHYDPAGNKDRETVVGAGTSLDTTCGPDQRGLATPRVDPRGMVPGADAEAYTSRFDYDERGQRVAPTRPAVLAATGGGCAAPPHRR